VTPVEFRDDRRPHLHGWRIEVESLERAVDDEREPVHVDGALDADDPFQPVPIGRSSSISTKSRSADRPVRRYCSRQISGLRDDPAIDAQSRRHPRRSESPLPLRATGGTGDRSGSTVVRNAERG
jgi:hypothetical protein